MRRNRTTSASMLGFCLGSIAASGAQFDTATDRRTLSHEGYRCIPECATDRLVSAAYGTRHDGQGNERSHVRLSRSDAFFTGDPRRCIEVELTRYLRCRGSDGASRCTACNCPPADSGDRLGQNIVRAHCDLTRFATKRTAITSSDSSTSQQMTHLYIV